MLAGRATEGVRAMLMWSTALPLSALCGDVKNARLRRFVRKTFEYLRPNREQSSAHVRDADAYNLLTVWTLLW